MKIHGKKGKLLPVLNQDIWGSGRIAQPFLTFALDGSESKMQGPESRNFCLQK
jgi:hypothetical protein